MATFKTEHRQYTDRWSRYCTDTVDEYTVITDADLNLNQFEKLLAGFGYLIVGAITYAKRRLTYADGHVEFKYIAECRMY